MSDTHQETAPEAQSVVLADIKNSRPPQRGGSYTMFGAAGRKTSPTKDQFPASKLVADTKVSAPLDSKKSAVSDYPELLQQDRREIESRLSHLKDRAHGRDKLAQALLTGNWEHSIFEDVSFPYYAADGLVETWKKEGTVSHIQEWQFATVTQYYHYREYAKNLKAVCLLNKDKSDFSEAGKQLIKFAQTMYPKNPDFPLPYFDETMAQEFLKKLQQMPASEQYAFVFTHHQELPFFYITPYETSFIFQLLDREMTLDDLVSKDSEEVAVLTCGAFSAFNAAMRGKNMALLKPFLGMASREYVEHCKRSNGCVISIFLPHTKLPEFLHHKKNNPITSTAHDLRHFDLMVSVDLEVREFAWFFLDELRKFLDDKTHAQELVSGTMEQHQNNLFWTKETWGIPDFTPDVPIIFFSPLRWPQTFHLKQKWKTLSAGQQNFIFTFELLSSLLINPDITRINAYIDLLTYFYLTFFESENFKKLGFDAELVVKQLQLYQPPDFLNFIRSRYKGTSMTVLGFLDFSVAKAYWQESTGLGKEVQVKEKLDTVMRNIVLHQTSIKFARKKPYEFCLMSSQIQLEPGKLYLSCNRRSGNLVYEFISPTDPEKTIRIHTAEEAPSPFTLDELEPVAKRIYRMAVAEGHIPDYVNCICLSIDGEVPPLDQPHLLVKSSRLKEIFANYEKEWGYGLTRTELTARIVKKGDKITLNLSKMKLGERTFAELTKLINIAKTCLPVAGFHALNLQDNQLYKLEMKGMRQFFELLHKLPKFHVLNLADNGDKDSFTAAWFEGIDPRSCFNGIEALQGLPKWIKTIKIMRFIDKPAPLGPLNLQHVRAFGATAGDLLSNRSVEQLTRSIATQLVENSYGFSYVVSSKGFVDFFNLAMWRKNKSLDSPDRAKIWLEPRSLYDDRDGLWDSDNDEEQDILPSSEPRSSSHFERGSPVLLPPKSPSAASSASKIMDQTSEQTGSNLDF